MVFENFKQRQRVPVDEIVSVYNLADVHRVIKNFSGPDARDAVVTADVEYMEDGQRRRERVEAHVKEPTPRSLLLEGLTLVKRRMEFLRLNAEANQENLDVQKIEGDVDATIFWVDALIKNRLGGRRHGLSIRWDSLPEGPHEWDPVTGQLSKVEPNAK